MSARRMHWGIVASCATLAIAVSPALDARADASFSWHMVQHLLILLVAPLLLLLAQPFTIFARIVGKRRTATFVLATRRLHGLAFPPLALTIYAGTLWITHFSGMYEAALEMPVVHVFEHGLYFVAGLMFWLPIICPAPLYPLAFPVRLLYVLVAIPQAPLLAIALDAARAPLYKHYLEFATSTQAIADQQAAAAVMWIGGGAILFAAFLITLGIWARRENRMSTVLTGCLAACLLTLAIGRSQTSPPILVHPPLSPKGRTVTPPPNPNPPDFTAEQARVGKVLYYENCAECHGGKGEGQVGPALITAAGNVQWQPIYYVYQYAHAHMPWGNASGLAPQDYVNIMAFLLESHGHQPSKTALTEKTLLSSRALLQAKP